MFYVGFSPELLKLWCIKSSVSIFYQLMSTFLNKHSSFRESKGADEFVLHNYGINFTCMKLIRINSLSTGMLS
jgi:hypothetical protein